MNVGFREFALDVWFQLMLNNIISGRLHHQGERTMILFVHPSVSCTKPFSVCHITCLDGDE